MSVEEICDEKSFIFISALDLLKLVDQVKNVIEILKIQFHNRHVIGHCQLHTEIQVCMFSNMIGQLITSGGCRDVKLTPQTQIFLQYTYVCVCVCINVCVSA